ncbi:hypothetical protein D0864_02491 [Hortaea werneckii]|uniref:Thioesterase domain-containing protein n=1 Tax=Hortaea werneckii TaxID=91943 RepID=A0A3M7GWG8_HORWE|nr:hypothetical protein D0862_06759 [Hortaea werneckii]RMZ05369.1 hypothetical protein D0864_02491 [Hortaea werneckii]
MSVWRGLQSAIFYYVSCAPCAEASYRKKRKRDAIRGRAERVELEREMGARLYRHPSPSSTNPHWATEIANGPTMTRGKRKGHATGQQDDSLKSRDSGGTQSTAGASRSNLASSVDLLPKAESRSGSQLKINPSQREDEELWGSSGSDPPLRSHLDGPSATHAPMRPPAVRTKDSSSSSVYHCYRNPPVNEKHPAIARKVHSREEVAWMLQPPPSPDVMKGKVQPRKPGSGSAGSKSRTTSAGSGTLSRPMSNEAIEQGSRSRVTSDVSLPLPAVAFYPDHPIDRPYEMSSGGLKTDRIDFASTPVKREKRKPSPLQLQPSEDSDGSTATVIRKRNLSLDDARIRGPKNTPSRPQLSTIMSDGTIPTETDIEFYTPASTPKENSIPETTTIRGQGEDSSESYDPDRRRSALVVKDGMKLLPDEKPPATKHITFNTTIFTASPGGGGALKRHSNLSGRQPVSHPPQDLDGEIDSSRHGSGASASSGPELFDSWYTPDFELGRWVHEHTKREFYTYLSETREPSNDSNGISFFTAAMLSHRHAYRLVFSSPPALRSEIVRRAFSTSPYHSPRLLHTAGGSLCRLPINTQIRSQSTTSATSTPLHHSPDHPPPHPDSTTPPPPRRLRRFLLTTTLVLLFSTAGFAMSAAPAADTINGFVNPPTDAESLTLYHATTPSEHTINDHILTHPLSVRLRAQEGMTESRPHLKIPESMRPHNLTGGTLLGEDKIVVPPLMFADKDAALPTLTSISYLGPALCGHPGIVHGGLLATMLDEGLARACFPALPNKVGVTASLKIDYRVPCPAESYVVLKAQTTKVEGRKAWVKGWIELLGEGDTEGTKLVEAEALFIEPKNAASMARVYSTQ